MVRLVVYSLLLVVVAGGCLGASGSAGEFGDATNVLDNGDFSSGTDNWEVNIEDKIRENNTYSLDVIDTENRTGVLNIFRSGSMEEGGRMRLIQDLGIDVSDAELLQVRADVRVINRTLEGSGWWSDVHDREGEYPLHFFVTYETADGERDVWSWGFLTDSNPDRKVNYDLVEPGEWYSFASGNIMRAKPPPSRIINFRIFAEGWDYHVQVDEVQLLVERAGD